jgi:GntR family transcriptional regulator, carbon starvation induced regulator
MVVSRGTIEVIEMSAIQIDSADKHEVSLADRAYSLLRRDILDGVFDPGQPLRLEALKVRYGLSFSPIREALTRLSSDHLVVLSSLRGFRVAPVSLDEMWDLISTRVLIEREALRRSIAKGDDFWEAAIVAALHALRRSSERVSSDPAAHEELEHRHADFHSALIAGCGSPSLMKIAAKLYVQSERYRRPTLFRDNSSVRDVMGEHEVIMSATIGRRPAEALKALTDHYEKTGHIIEAVLSKTAVASEPQRRRRFKVASAES